MLKNWQFYCNCILYILVIIQEDLHDDVAYWCSLLPEYLLCECVCDIFVNRSRIKGTNTGGKSEGKEGLRQTGFDLRHGAFKI